ncbi:MAG: gamma-glutamyl-gamma-aminobutyrate hydrolase family protein [Rickettsiales bacterium]|jgi:putative glutamine amidotransferase|nr:gamma-glutamyl-gamma-aminobutyrate hydrolase family protein [Rickettsiales bacterium]
MKPPKILICADPANKESAGRMALKLQEKGAEFKILENYDQCMFTGRLREQSVSDLLEKYDGLVVMGNDAADVAPESYGARMHPRTANEWHNTSNKNRAIFESKLIKNALDLKMPIFGICGGMQRINTVCGGTLRQHIPDVIGNNSHSQESCGIPPQEPAHDIITVTGTKFAAMNKAFDPSCITPDPAASTKHAVNSRHHQCVDKIGTGLRVAAYAEEPHPQHQQKIRITEAIEADPHGRYKDQFILGVQFHPELMADQRMNEAIAARLKKEAESYHHRKERKERSPHKFTSIVPQNGSSHANGFSPAGSHQLRVFDPDEKGGVGTIQLG